MKLITYYKYDENGTHTEKLSHIKVYKNLNGQHLKEAQKTNTYMKDISEIDSKVSINRKVNEIMNKIEKSLKKDEEIKEIVRLGVMEYMEDNEEKEEISVEIEVDEEEIETIETETEKTENAIKTYIIHELEKKLKRNGIEFENLGRYSV